MSKVQLLFMTAKKKLKKIKTEKIIKITNESKNTSYKITSKDSLT